MTLPSSVMLEMNGYDPSLAYVPRDHDEKHGVTQKIDKLAYRVVSIET